MTPSRLDLSKGFTLVEMVVVMAILAGLATALIFNFRVSATNKTARHQVSSVVVSDIRRAQSMALSGSQFEASIVCGYGIHYLDGQTYLIYAKSPVSGLCVLSSRNYVSGDPVVETKKIANSNVEIQTPFLDIFFEPPDPKTYVDNVALLTNPPTTTAINLIITGSTNCTSQNCTTITISTSGSIDVTN